MTRSGKLILFPDRYLFLLCHWQLVIYLMTTRTYVCHVTVMSHKLTPRSEISPDDKRRWKYSSSSSSSSSPTELAKIPLGIAHPERNIKILFLSRIVAFYLKMLVSRRKQSFCLANGGFTHDKHGHPNALKTSKEHPHHSSVLSF
ncbi:hypothetical protein AVEN_131931-1 [Araneus ventricosus]|uniref:Uncharacterized protein n=1 Tax=Araneus ventricosus TaxID=182803 RepID=A0A4Y2B551_ARAVE|nr:hypothetical protein AVEN_131931-1 [Araneus ventricosus]